MNKEKRIARLLCILVTILLVSSGLLLIPWIYERYLAMGNLLNHEILPLKKGAGLLVGCGILLFLFRAKMGPRVSMVLFGISLLILTELGFRMFGSVFFNSDTKWTLEKQGLNTYPEYTAYAGHPFLNFTGRPKRDTKSKDFKNPYHFNKMGFNDVNREFAKPDSIFRIAALGASTTERGYPKALESILDSAVNIDKDVDVLNFGLSCWTTAHSMINFLLNVVEFDPDMVIIHHGWNDSQVRDTPIDLFRSDYSHAYKYFHEPEMRDRLIVRLSLLYRFIKWKLKIKEGWMYLDRAILNRDRPREDKGLQDPKELKPYDRNIRTIIDHALIHDIHVVLLTMPHSTDPNAELYYQFGHMDQCNFIVREMARDYGDKLTFVDLDSLMTGKDNSLFIDLAHMSDPSKRVKSQHIANAILSRMSENEVTVE